MAALRSAFSRTSASVGLLAGRFAAVALVAQTRTFGAIWLAARFGA